MANIWFCSDHHFHHANILTFTNQNTGELIRPGFKDVFEMNERMIENHNKVVGPYDKVYFLGDVCMGNVEKLNSIMPRLNGKKRLCLGNHDAQSYDIKHYLPHFEKEKIMLWRQFKNMKYPFIACHVPMHEDGLHGRGCVWNVHGHIHERVVKLPDYKGWEGAPDKRYINVCMEQTNYTPVNMDELQERMAKTGL